jgi:hypothetical protein
VDLRQKRRGESCQTLEDDVLYMKLRERGDQGLGRRLLSRTSNSDLGSFRMWSFHGSTSNLGLYRELKSLTVESKFSNKLIAVF